MENKHVAKVLYEIADILEVQEVAFKPRAYRRAAMGIEALSEDICKIAKKGIKELEKIPGVGESIAHKIIEICNTGKLKYLNDLKKKSPVHIEELAQIEGIGPKTIKKLYNKLNIKTLPQLKKAAKSHKIQKLKGFSSKTEFNILRGIEFTKKSKGRMLLGYAFPIAEEIIEDLKKHCVKIELAGSIRRKNETIGDIDILACTKDASNLIKIFTSLEQVKRVIAKGTKKTSVTLEDGVQVDLRILDQKSWGSGLMYFTGSKQHNIELRKIAIKQKLKLSEYGVFKGARLLGGKTEKQVYKILGLQYIPPELRENQGEIESALNQSIPKLIECSDIKGDLHSHTFATDGSNSIEEMALAAKKLKLKYLAITDHTGSLKIAGGLSDNQLTKHIKGIDKVDKRIRGITLLKGCEANIKNDGSIDVSNKVLKKMDIVLAGIHSGFKNSSSKITKRITKAMENPYVNVIVHPTGRILKRREAYKINFEKICQTAKDTNTCLEIDSYPDRLDLNASHIKTAIELGVKLSLGSDSHSTDHFKFLRLGAFTARRGWAKKKDIINTFSVKKMLKTIRKV